MIKTLIGLVGVVLMNSSALPQIYKTIKTKKVNDMSIWREVLLFSGVGLYLFYGISIKNIVIVISNCIGVFIFSTLIFLHFKYGDKREVGKETY